MMILQLLVKAESILIHSVSINCLVIQLILLYQWLHRSKASKLGIVFSEVLLRGKLAQTH